MSPNVGRHVKVDGQTCESWSAVLDGFRDATIYQTWSYGAVRWGSGNLSHLVLFHDGGIVAAVQLRIARIPMLRTGIAFARWGPLCRPNDLAPDRAIISHMLACLHEEYCRRRGLILQLYLNDFPDNQLDYGHTSELNHAGFRVDPGKKPYSTVRVDLSPTLEVIRKRLHQKWRNQLNGAERNEMEFEVTESQDGYLEFERLYQSMWSRKRFKTSVDIKDFGHIQAELPAHQKMWIFIARKKGEAVGALVCSLMGDSAIYLLGATNDRARQLKASYFLHWQAMAWLRRHGARWYDLGGVDPVSNAGGYHFKSGFGGTEVTQRPPLVATNGLLGELCHRGISLLHNLTP